MLALVCLVAEGTVLAETQLADGTPVRARPGALEVGDTRITACEGLPDAAPTALAVRGGLVAVGFRQGAFLFDPVARTFTAVGPRLPTRALAADGDTLYVGTSADGLWRVAGTAGEGTRVAGALGRGEISALAAGPKGLDVGAGGRGWWRVAGHGPGTPVQKGVYAGCFRRGRPRPPGPACGGTPATAASGLPSAHLTSLVVHRGNLYAGTFDRGIARLGTDGRFVPIPGSPPFINTLLSTPAGLVAGTPKGLFREEDGGFRRLDLGDGLDHVNAVLLGSGGTLWIATSGGIVALAPDGRVRVLSEASGLPGRIAHSLAETSDGALWVGTLTGLVRLDGHSVTRFSRAAGNLPHDWVTAILPDGDGVLAGTYDAGVWRLTPSGVGMPVPGLERLWVNPAGLSRAAGALSVATLGDGLILGGRRVAGLPSDDVTAVIAFAGKLWIATRGGLATSTSGA